jgi:hypothetical protein
MLHFKLFVWYENNSKHAFALSKFLSAVKAVLPRKVIKFLSKKEAKPKTYLK